MSRNFGHSPNWDRAFYAARTDEPLMASAIISRGTVFMTIPPATGSQEDVNRLLQFLGERVVNPHLRPGQRRKR